MGFLSLSYFLFFPLTALVYFLLPGRGRNGWLLVCSWFFYLCAGPESFPFLLGAALVTYFAARALEKRPRKGLLVLALCLFIGVLFLFKYLDFGASLLVRALGWVGLDWAPAVPKLLLPAGISFYLFAAMGYLMDVYRGRLPAERSFVKCALFLSFFPYLLSGPIGRAEQLLPQFNETHRFRYDDLREGLLRFLWGAFQKLVLADRLAAVVDTVFAAPDQFGAVQVVAAACAFSIQIYCDFSAYSDMALGSAKAMGFTLMENFRTPYFSRSIAEFWRRWHISLGTWFREYLYIPLGGNRVSKPRLFFNLLVVWAATGIWHGASWNFLIWGLYFAVLLILEKAFLGKLLQKLPAALQHLYTLFLVLVSWAIFAVEDFGHMGAYLKAMFGLGGGLTNDNVSYYFFSFLPMLIIAAVASTPLAAKLWKRLPEKPRLALLPILLLAGLVFSTAYLVDATYNPFLYFRF